MLSINLNFINQADTTSPLNLVIYQKNEVSAAPDIAVAWQVCPTFAPGTKFPLAFTLDTTISANDGFGQELPQQPAPDGSAFTVAAGMSGPRLVPAAAISPAQGVIVTNDFPVGAINVSYYRGGNLLAQKTGIAPGKTAQFVFMPNIYVALLPGIIQGAAFTLTSLSPDNAMFSLLGIRSADIVLTGGGQGTGAKPFTFFLENVVMG